MVFTLNIRTGMNEQAMETQMEMLLRSSLIRVCNVSQTSCTFYTDHQLVKRTFSELSLNITKTCLYNFDPLKSHFYVVKLGFTGVYIIFLISAQN